jgi:hypothetical protein
MSDAAWTYAFLCLSAFVAGVMNSVAGGGTLLTFPALQAVIGSVAANATSTVALCPGSLAGAWGYRNELRECWPTVTRLLAPSLLGGAIGSYLVFAFDQKVFEALVPWLILVAALLFLVQKPLAKWIGKGKPADRPPGPRTHLGVFLFQFGVALYGGYFGAGIGILMLTALSFLAVGDIHRMNAIKTILAAAINGTSVVVFIVQTFLKWPEKVVVWQYALAMAAAAVLGGYAGARVARRLPASYVRWTVIVIGFGLAAFEFYKQFTRGLAA